MAEERNNRDMLTSFDRRIALLGTHSAFQGALVDVCDTAETVKLWFDSSGLTPAAADVVAMTALVMDRQREISETFGGECNEDD